MEFYTLLTKSMRDKMRGPSAAGDDPHTAGANTWMRRWEKGEKFKKNPTNLESARGGAVWRSKQRREIQLEKWGHRQKDSAVAVSR